MAFTWTQEEIDGYTRQISCANSPLNQKTDQSLILGSQMKQTESNSPFIMAASSAKQEETKTFSSELPWSKQEDDALSLLVKRIGPKWIEIEAIMKTRTAKQLEARYMSFVNTIYEKDWTLEEDMLLFKLYKDNGPCWMEIAKRMNNKTDLMVKNRFYSTISKKLNRKNLKLQVQINGVKSDQEIPTARTLPKELIIKQTLDDQEPNVQKRLLQAKGAQGEAAYFCPKGVMEQLQKAQTPESKTGPKKLCWIPIPILKVTQPLNTQK